MLDYLFLTPIVTEFATVSRHFRPARRQQEEYRVQAASIGSRSVGVLQTGMGSARMRKAIQWASRSLEPRHCVVVGFAGGLADHLAIGDVVVPASIRREGREELRCDPLTFGATPLAATLQALRVHEGPIVEVDRIAATREQKVGLRESTGADVVDMESYTAVETCHRLRKPVSVVRFISDASTSRLPAEVSQLLDDAGNPKFFRAAKLIMARPRLLMELLTMERGTKATTQAMSAWLREVRSALEQSPGTDHAASETRGS